MDTLRNVITSGYVILPNQQVFRNYIIFSFLTKCLRGPDETASRAGFGPRAVVLETPILQDPQKCLRWTSLSPQNSRLILNIST